MTITQLEYIIAVDTHRHFARAADSCFVTQPTLSMQIQKLEEELGVTIFDRSRKPLQPTDVGKQIIEQARTVIIEEKRIKELIQLHKGEIAGDFKLAIIPTVSTSLLPRFLKSFLKKYPKVKAIRVTPKTEAQLCSEVPKYGATIFAPKSSVHITAPPSRKDKNNKYLPNLCCISVD